MISKIDGTICKNILGLSIHLKKYGLSTLEYFIKYENFQIPNCICGKEKKHMNGLSFRETCGSVECLTNKKSKKLSSETKEKIRKSRFNFLKKRTGNTAWERRSNGEMSFLEKWFDDKCKQFNLYSKYDICYDYSEYPYFIDFAFLNVKVAVELDGKCHFINGTKRVEHDFKKDDDLIQKGWRVFRIRYDEIKDDSKIYELLLFIGEKKEKNYDNRLYKYIELKKSKVIILKEKTNRKGVLISDLKQMVLNSNIDFTTQGWVKEVSEILQISENKGGLWVKKNLPDLYEVCYKRGNNIKSTKNNIKILKDKYYQEQLKLIEIVTNSKIDFSKIGWKRKVSILLGIDRQVVHIWMAKYMPELLLKSKNNKDYTNLVNFYKENQNLLKKSNYIFYKSKYTPYNFLELFNKPSLIFRYNT